MPEPTVIVRMKEDGFRMAFVPCAASCLGDAFRQLVRQLFAGNVHMSKFQFRLVAASVPEVR